MLDYLSREECKAIQINILDAVVAICNAQNLQYFLAYGTLLGAIRHKGFIPWDDDIDIYLPRYDYEKLIEYIKTKKKEIPEWLELYDGDRQDYYYPFAKAVDRNTIAKMEDNITEHGIWVDIFPEDNVPDTWYRQNSYVRKGKFYRDVIIAMTADFSRSQGGIKTIAKRIINVVAKLFGKDKIYDLAVKHYTKYKNSETTKAACMTTPYGLKEIATKKELFTPTMVEFEGKEYQATCYWDKYLSRLYGDYMRLPPEHKRKIHSITAWRKAN